MGFFSWNCKICGRSIPNQHVDEPGEYCQATAIYPNGDIVHGIYDGYGNIGVHKFANTMNADKATLYHTKCWRGEGSPTDYKGPSDNAEDQGHFLDLCIFYGCSECGSTDCGLCEDCSEPACMCTCQLSDLDTPTQGETK